MLLANLQSPLDEEARRTAAAEAAERALDGEMRRAEPWLDLEHPENKAELGKDTALADRIPTPSGNNRELNGETEETEKKKKKSRLFRMLKRIKSGEKPKSRSKSKIE